MTLKMLITILLLVGTFHISVRTSNGKTINASFSLITNIIVLILLWTKGF